MAKILLIEDDEHLRSMLGESLGLMGHTVIKAGNGREGLAAFAAAPVDLVLTDIVMPDMEGIETITRMRQQAAGVKIIAMSGGGRNCARDYLHLAQMLGATRTLIKPFTREELTAAITEVLGEKPV